MAAASGEAFALPNRKAFADYIARIYLKYRSTDKKDDDEGVDACLNRSSSKNRELLPYQKLVRDYLMLESPYRGLLVYHGLGSGKTCSSIGVAESLLNDKKIFVLLPASLQDNFRQELRTCGNPIYMNNNYWETRIINNEADKGPALAMKIPDEFLRKQGRYFVTVPGKESNYNTLPLDVRRGIDGQISALIDARYTFINYNGLNSESVKVLIPEEDAKTSTKFDNSVVIIDEAHNLISRVISDSSIGKRLYDAIYYAKECKVVLLSGTPIINRPNEVAYFMNLLRGPIERILIPVKELPTWDEAGMKTFFQKMPEVDTVEFNSVKRTIQVTRNPPHFRSIYGAKGDRIAVKYDEALEYKNAKDWVESSVRPTFPTTFPGGVLAAREYVTVEYLECLPTNFSEFMNTFVDGLNVKNALLFQKRIQGLVSYFKGSDERMLPKRIEDAKMLEKIEMSDEQFNVYLERRWQEIQAESKKSSSGGLNDDFSYYRVLSRLVCNYAVPLELRKLMSEEDIQDENKEADKSVILDRLRANPDKYLRDAGLAIYSPKMRKMLANIKEEGFNNQFIYSQYKELEGLGILSAILDANGYQRYKLAKEGGKYRESPDMDPAKPAYAMYTGDEDVVEKELVRCIFNEDYKSIQAKYPEHATSLFESMMTARGGKHILCILMATSSGAEGINLKNVRRLHITEPHWNPARHDQVMGRGIRLCSHATRQILQSGSAFVDQTIPIEERTIRISFYLSVFSKEQATSVTAFNVVPIRRADTRTKKYDAPPGEEGARAPEAFLSSDEFLYEVSYEKGKITEGITKLIKQAAVDCEIHRKLHSREKPVLQCLRFDSTVKGEDLAYNPNMKNDERDETYLRNIVKRSRRLQRIKIKDIVFLVDPDSKEVFDEPAFGDANRLLRIGTLTPTSIRFFTGISSE